MSEPKGTLHGLTRALPLKPVELLVLGYLSYEDLSAYDVFRKFEVGYRSLRPWFVWNKRSVYNTVARLEGAGRLEVMERRSDGRRPEKTVYRITGQGRTALRDLVIRDWNNPTAIITNLFPDMFFSNALDRDALIGCARGRLEWIDASLRVMEEIRAIQPCRAFHIILEGRMDVMKALRRACARFLKAVSEEDLDALYRRRAVSPEKAEKELSRRLRPRGAAGSRKKKGDASP